MQKQTVKTNNKKVVAQDKQVKIVDYKETICNKIKASAKANNLIKLQDVTGYTALKFANKTIAELHFKRKAISHFTISNTSKAFEILKAHKLVTRIVPKTYGWRLNTECLITAEFMAQFDSVLKALLQEAEEERNLKAKKAEKVAKKA